MYAAFVAVPQLGLQRFGSFLGIDLAVARVPHRVVLGRSFLDSVIISYDGLRAQATFASLPDPYRWALLLDAACRALVRGSGVTGGTCLQRAAQPAQFASVQRS